MCMATWLRRAEERLSECAESARYDKTGWNHFENGQAIGMDGYRFIALAHPCLFAGYKGRISLAFSQQCVK